jgi:hypothetical protein
MMPPVAPVEQHRPGGPSRVIQGFFPAGQPRIPQAPRPPLAPQPAPFLPRPASVQPAMAPGRPNPIQPSARPGIPAGRLQPILPTAGRPFAVQAFSPVKPAGPAAILPPAARLACVQPSPNQAFALPPGFQLRPSGLGQRLPEAVQQKMEAFFGTSFGDVHVHVGNEASSIGAFAFTHGSDLYFAPGQYNPQTPQGQQLLGHELTHVVQQRAGRVRHSLGSGVAVIQDPALEAEAERMGQRAATVTQPIQAKPAGAGPVVATVQSAGSRPNTQPLRSPHPLTRPQQTMGDNSQVVQTAARPVNAVETYHASETRARALALASNHRGSAGAWRAAARQRRAYGDPRGGNDLVTRRQSPTVMIRL